MVRDRLFDGYLFADYSGAFKPSAQRKAIRLAQASRSQAPALVDKRPTRDELIDEFVSRLSSLTNNGHLTTSEDKRFKRCVDYIARRYCRIGGPLMSTIAAALRLRAPNAGI